MGLYKNKLNKNYFSFFIFFMIRCIAVKYGNGISLIHETVIRGKISENIKVL